MRSGGAAGGADLADDLAGLDGVADFGIDAGEVTVACRHAVAVIDLDHLAIAALPAGECHCAVRGRTHRVPRIAAHVEAGVHRGRFQEWIDPHAEARRGIDLTGDRPAYRYVGERAIELIDVGAGKPDA